MSVAPQSWQFKIHGMDCAEEVAVLQREIGPLVGGESQLQFDVLNGRMTVTPVPAGVSFDEVVDAVARTGLRAEPYRLDTHPERESSERSGNLRLFLTVTSGAACAFGFLLHAWQAGGITEALHDDGPEAIPSVPLVARWVYGLSIAAGVWLVLPKAGFALRRFRPDMNLLMTIAVAGAVAIGEWFEAATVAFLFSLSLLLESWSVGRARRAIAALMDLTPTEARIVQDNGTERLVPPGDVSVGVRFIVKPGERIPLDGVVTGGLSHVNQAPITGESMPIAKQSGDAVFAGTINGDGALTVECTKPAGETTLAHIIRLVDEAHTRRAPSEQWVERFARVYTPVVMGLALGVWLLPPLAFGQLWGIWTYNALVLLVIACPCALVISTPVSIVAALASAARQGVLIKGGTFVEAPARLKAIAFDKTGTLTEGHPAVVEVIPLGGHDERELLERAAAMELRSEHPLARAIVTYAAEKGVSPAPADEFQIIQGKGATARFADKRFWIGSHRYLEERGQETPEIHEQLVQLSGAGRSIVVVGNEQHVCGLITLADRIRGGCRNILDTLHQAGIERLVMLTGDNEPTARAIAHEIGVDEFRAELLPQDKVTAVEELVRQYTQVAMIGDGINDAPAIARASIGIAMGAAGSDAAIETADIALMSDDLSRIPWLIHHSRRTLAIIRQNIVFALSVKGLFVILTLAGFASLWSAIAADMGASLLVIFNGLRLLNENSDAK